MEAHRIYTGYVVGVNDGIAMINLDMPLDVDGQPDFNKWRAEHGEDVPDFIEIEAEPWMQEDTRLVISITRHPDDEPSVATREQTDGDGAAIARRTRNV